MEYVKKYYLFNQLCSGRIEGLFWNAPDLIEKVDLNPDTEKMIDKRKAA